MCMHKVGNTGIFFKNHQSFALLILHVVIHYLSVIQKTQVE